MEVSEETTTFLRSCFGKPLTNAARHGLKKPVGVPKVDATKCPKLDRVIKGSVSKDTKEADGTLAKLQTLLLDAVAPLVHILETAHSGNLTVDTSVKAAKLALRLLANASVHISKERRKTSLKDLNRDLLTLVEDDEMFADVAPMLFGDGFEKTMKEHVEAMRCIRKTSSKTSNESFFSEGPPPGPISPLPWGRQQPKRKRPVPPVSVPRQPLQQSECRKRELPEKEPVPSVKRQRTLRVETNLVQTPEIVYAYINLPVLSILPELQHFYPSITVTQLRAKGIASPNSSSASKTVNFVSRQTFALPGQLAANHARSVGPGSN